MAPNWDLTSLYPSPIIIMCHFLRKHVKWAIHGSWATLDSSEHVSSMNLHAPSIYSIGKADPWPPGPLFGFY